MQLAEEASSTPLSEQDIDWLHLLLADWQVLADLAAGMPVSRRSLEAWFRATGLSRDGRFELAVVDYGYRDDERQLAVNACLRLLDLFPDAVVGLQDNRALVLRSLADCG